MSINVNHVVLAGNLTSDPQVRFLANERAVANFSLAINRRFKGANGEQKEEVTFVDVEAWARTAELVGQYLVKGSGALIEGRLKLDAWEDRQSHQKRTRLKVVADTVQFLGSRRDRLDSQAGDTAEAAGQEPPVTPAAGQLQVGPPTAPSPAIPRHPVSAPAPRPHRPVAAAAPPADDEPPF